MAEENSRGGPGARRRRSRNLPDELQEEILRHLPAKSLTRFESVCKTWQSKFHSRSFIDLYGRRHPLCIPNNNSLGIRAIQGENLWKMFPELGQKLKRRLLRPMNTKPEEWRIWNRVSGPLSNGIYCITSIPCNTSFDRFCVFPGKIGLCNPATHNYKFTNPFPDRIRSLLDKIASKSCQIHIGFGQITSSLGDYKVVVIVHHGESFVSLVYSLQRGKWKEIHGKAKQAFNSSVGRRIIKINYPFQVCPQRFLEGCWHWAAIGEGGSSYYVLSFNFADEAFKLIGAPSRYPEEHVPSRGSVFVLHDHLAFIYLSHSMLPQRVEVEVDVWMMMEYGVEKSWTRIYKINPNFSGMLWRFVGIDCTPLGLGGDEESGVVRVEKLFFEEYDEHQIISCDDAGHQVLPRDLCGESGLWDNATDSTNFFWNTRGISTYVETLERL